MAGNERNLPVDTSVKVPRGVMAAAEQADAIHKQAYQTEDAPPAAATAQQEAPPAAAAAPPQEQQQPPQESADDWKHRYQSLNGRYSSLQNTMNNQATKIANLESMLASLNKPTPAAQPQSSKKLVTPEEETEYGKDFLDVVARKAREALTPVIEERVNSVRREVKTELGQVNNTAQEAQRAAQVNQKEKLLRYMDDSLSNWREVNVHPKFLNWLTLTDPLSGARRRVLLNDAYERNDAVRVLSFYRAFLTEEGTPPPAVTQPNGAAAPNGAAGKIPLTNLAAPGKPSASATLPVQPPGGRPTISRAQITTYYANKRRGMYSEKEVAEHEAELQLALAEGRITN